MKNAFLLLLVLTFSSCYKDNPNEETPIITTWVSTRTVITSSEYNGTELIKSETVTYAGQPNEFITIGGNGQLGWRTIERGYNPDGTVWYGTDYQMWNTVYSRSGSSLVIGEGTSKKSYTISTLNNQKMVLEHSSIGYSGGRKYTQSSRFEFSK